MKSKIYLIGLLTCFIFQVYSQAPHINNLIVNSFEIHMGQDDKNNTIYRTDSIDLHILIQLNQAITDINTLYLQIGDTLSGTPSVNKTLTLNQTNSKYFLQDEYNRLVRLNAGKNIAYRIRVTKTLHLKWVMAYYKNATDQTSSKTYFKFKD